MTPEGQRRQRGLHAAWCVMIVVLLMACWWSGGFTRWTARLVEADIEMYGVTVEGVTID